MLEMLEYSYNCVSTTISIKYICSMQHIQIKVHHLTTAKSVFFFVTELTT